MALPSPLLCLLLLVSVAVLSATSGVYGLAPIEKMIHLHFYFHEIFGGPNATTITVVNPPAGNNSYNDFGSIGVGYNMLREGADPESPLIGRAQELAVQASLEGPAYMTLFNFVFTSGKYNGSSISIFGWGVLTDLMDRGIVGGTGKFRMARGYTLSKLVTRTVTGDVIYLVVEYDAYIYQTIDSM